MKRQATFYGVVQGGKLKLQAPGLFAEFVKNFPDDTSVELTLGKQYDDISRNQMGYYFGVIIPAAMKHFGYNSSQEVDGIFKAMFLMEYPGTEFEQLKSKTSLDSYEMSEFIEKVIVFMGQEGVVIEPADREWKQKRI